jgi:hypothetical protein
MDTRSKIAGPGTVAAVKPGLRVVSGYFDPLLRAHVDELEQLSAGGGLAVVIVEPEEPLLPARARAELVAALGCVEAVYLDGAGAPEADARLEEGHDRVRADFIRHVRERQS